jgi:hypothetical protein
VIGYMSEVLVGRQHRQVMAYAQLSQKRVDCSDLHAISAAMISQLRRPDVVVAIRYQQRHRRKSIQDLIAASRPREALKQFLENQARRQKRFTVFDCMDQHPDLPTRSRPIASQRQ